MRKGAGDCHRDGTEITLSQLSKAHIRSVRLYGKKILVSRVKLGGSLQQTNSKQETKDKMLKTLRDPIPDPMCKEFS